MPIVTIAIQNLAYDSKILYVSENIRKEREQDQTIEEYAAKSNSQLDAF